MESSALGLMLDSSVVIEAERQLVDVAGLLRQAAARMGDFEVALCSITVAELAHGTHRANTPERRQVRRAFLDDVKLALPVYPITVETGESVGRIGAECAQRGVIIPFDDLLIGVCALELGYAIATRNERHFRKIPDLMIVAL